MKKSKDSNAYWIQENFQRYRIHFLILNLFTFILIIALLGVIIVLSTNQRFYDSSKQDVLDYIANLNSSTYDIKRKLKSPDPRMTLVYYYVEPLDLTSSPYGTLPGSKTYVVGSMDGDLENLNLELHSSFYQHFEVQKINRSHYLIYSTKTNFKIDLDGSGDLKTIYCVKTYMNVDGELNSKKNLITTYVISAIAILVLCAFASYFMMQRATKPLGEFVDRHVSFISDASHELRTPLAVVQSKLENIMAHPDATVYDVLEDLSVSLKELSRLNRLTSELLLLTRNDQNLTNLNTEVVNLDKVLEEIIEPFKEIAVIQERNLSYQGMDAIVQIDRDKFRQIMIILIDNAMKYTNIGDSISVLLTCTNSKAIVEVKDTGIGITEETKNRIFERFYREEKARNHENGGNGLGLSIAKTLVEAMNGTIEVEHNEPKGTKFMIQLPKIKS